jgi:transcriptional regulator with XRE-family HTH domain
MQEPPTWRDLLSRITQDPHEKQRIANELGVNPITLMRWVHNESRPHMQNLQRLLQALPEHQNVLRKLIAEEFTELSLPAKEDLPQEIPSRLYGRVINAYADALPSQRFWSITNLVLLQALRQLDPDMVGMAITVAQCMPPLGANKVRSLRELTGRGNPPWNPNLEEQAVFFGIESLAGYAVNTGHPLVIQGRGEQQGLYPAHWVEWENSASVCPIVAGGRVAGCLLVSSTQPHYFLPFRQALIQDYAKLLVLAFERGEFYALQDINLQPMPPYHVQESYWAGYRKRVTALMVEATKNRQSITLMQAEQLAWQQLEEELLQLPPYTAKPA